MRKASVELIVGTFVLAALVVFGYFTARIGAEETLTGSVYEVSARFSDVGNLKKGADVLIAGVPIGRVRAVSLQDYQARVVMAISEDVKVQDDAIASVKTRGLFGEAFVEIAPGGSEVNLKPGDQIRDTQPAIDLYSLVAKYIFEQKPAGELK